MPVKCYRLRPLFQRVQSVALGTTRLASQVDQQAWQSTRLLKQPIPEFHWQLFKRTACYLLEKLLSCHFIKRWDIERAVGHFVPPVTIWCADQDGRVPSR